MEVTLHTNHIKMIYLENIISNLWVKEAKEATSGAKAMVKENGFRVQGIAKSATKDLELRMFMIDLTQENKTVLKEDPGISRTL